MEKQLNGSSLVLPLEVRPPRVPPRLLLNKGIQPSAGWGGEGVVGLGVEGGMRSRLGSVSQTTSRGRLLLIRTETLYGLIKAFLGAQTYGTLSF